MPADQISPTGDATFFVLLEHLLLHDKVVFRVDRTLDHMLVAFPDLRSWYRVRTSRPPAEHKRVAKPHVKGNEVTPDALIFLVLHFICQRVWWAHNLRERLRVTRW